MHCATTVTQVFWQKSALVIKEWHSRSWKDLPGSSSLSPSTYLQQWTCVLQIGQANQIQCKILLFWLQKYKKNTLKHALAEYSIWKIKYSRSKDENLNMRKCADYCKILSFYDDLIFFLFRQGEQNANFVEFFTTLFLPNSYHEIKIYTEIQLVISLNWKLLFGLIISPRWLSGAAHDFKA